MQRLEANPGHGLHPRWIFLFQHGLPLSSKKQQPKTVKTLLLDDLDDLDALTSDQRNWSSDVDMAFSDFCSAHFTASCLVKMFRRRNHASSILILLVKSPCIPCYSCFNFHCSSSISTLFRIKPHLFRANISHVSILPSSSALFQA